MRKQQHISNDDLVKFYYESMKGKVRQFKDGHISAGEYNEWVFRCYDGLKRLGVKDTEAKDILSEIERIA